MQRTPHRCPQCAQAVWIHADMWGRYYVCDECGWTGEDDAALATVARRADTAISAIVGAERDFNRKPRAFS
jgi:ribosomal protein L37AE/L43A